MKVIVTKANADGTFDEVGMSNRTVIGPYKQSSRIMVIVKEYANGNRARVEWFADDNIQSKPSLVTYVNNK